MHGENDHLSDKLQEQNIPTYSYSFISVVGQMEGYIQ